MDPLCETWGVFRSYDMTHIAIRQGPRQMEEKSAMLDLNRSVTNQNLCKFSIPQARLCSFVMSPPPPQSSSSFQVSIEIVGAIHSVRLWRRERARERGRKEVSLSAPPFTVAAVAVAVTDRKECNFPQPQPKQEPPRRCCHVRAQDGTDLLVGMLWYT